MPFVLNTDTTINSAYAKVLDFLTIYHTNRDRIKESLLRGKIAEIGLEATLERLITLKF